ncbi:MAG: PEPxxWA-CTERM sorting domain-containing protein [Proteobacteria bacterium]|nr:PEPxxWA-CTERM sorting domain-containing protein [Pseudomonadota bacterium]
MKKFLFGAAVAAIALSAAPASAVVLTNGSSGLAPTPFAGIAGSQGTLLAYQTITGSAITFSAEFRQAVYKNANGTLDFYYQVLRTGAGTGGNEEVDGFTVASFKGFSVDGYASGPDIDGAGPFAAVNNGFLADGVTASGSTTTFGRSNSGDVVRVNFGLNGLSGTENSATYVFRTNATAFTTGTFGVIDGSTLAGVTFAPTVPEPATWAMMLGGFGLLGGAVRRSRRQTTVLA